MICQWLTAWYRLRKGQWGEARREKHSREKQEPKEKILLLTSMTEALGRGWEVKPGHNGRRDWKGRKRPILNSFIKHAMLNHQFQEDLWATEVLSRMLWLGKASLICNMKIACITPTWAVDKMSGTPHQ